MKDFIKKYLTKTILILAVIVGLLLVFTQFDKCSVKKTSNVVAGVMYMQWKQNFKDSLLKVEAKHDIAIIDSMNGLRASDRAITDKKIEKLSTKSTVQETKLASKIQDYNNDTTAQSDQCDSVISDFQDVVQTKDSTINELKTNEVSYGQSISDLNRKYEIQKAETDRSDQSNQLANKNIEILTKELNKKDNWWKRNEKWVFLGAGIVGTGLVLR